MTPKRIGRYEISDELGRGGMAVVYRGFDPVIKRAAAVKLIRKADLDPLEAGDILERFKREAQAAGRLHHPNIVAIYEHGEDDAYEWIAMELVEGKSLRDHLIEGWRPDLSRLPIVLEQLLEALDYSHAQGVVHRDVKPGNVLVSEMGIAKMSDFGIARIERSHLTQKGEMFGTPFYMAPEQYDGKPVDERTDVYAAGLIVYEVLCGRRPFDGEGGNLLRQILQEPPPPASSFEPRLPISIDTVLARVLAKDPGKRYRGAREFLDALRQAFPGDPGVSPLVSPKRGIAGNVGALRRALAASGGASAPATTALETTATQTPAPIVPDAPQGVEAALARRPAPRRPAVLFVDDEERVLNALAYLFRDQYEVETATSGSAALARLGARRFQVLVSDQRMPGMPGVELLREAKGIAPETVRLLLTGYSDLAAIVGSVNESEVFRFVSKPWNEEDLRSTLAEAADVAIALEAAAAAPVSSVRGTGSVLVIGDAMLGRALRELARDAFLVRDAAGTEAALAMLSAEEVAALVCDLDGAGDAAALLRVLKKQSPQTQLIAASASADSDLIISMINEARIYRFVKKPVNLLLLHGILNAALQRHARLSNSPAMLRSESAKASKRGVAEESILGRIKALGGRFAAAFKI